MKIKKKHKAWAWAILLWYVMGSGLWLNGQKVYSLVHHHMKHSHKVK